MLSRSCGTRFRVAFGLIETLGIVFGGLVACNVSGPRSVQVYPLADGWRVTSYVNWSFDEEAPDFWIELSGPGGQRLTSTVLDWGRASETPDQAYDDILERRLLFGWFQSPSGRYLALTRPGETRTVLAIVDLRLHEIWPRGGETPVTADSLRRLTEAMREIRRGFGEDCPVSFPDIAFYLPVNSDDLDSCGPPGKEQRVSGGSTGAEKDDSGGEEE